MLRITFLLLIFPLLALAQPRQLEELRLSKPDTSKVAKLLDLQEYYIHKGNRTAEELDTCYILARQAELLSISLRYKRGEGNACIVLSRVCRLRNQPVRGKHYLARAMNLFTEGNRYDMLGEAHEESATYLPFEVDKDVFDRIACLEKALFFYKKGGRMKMAGDTEKGIGEYYSIVNDYPKAWIHLNKANEIFKSIGHTTRLQNLYDLLGIVATMMSDYETGLKYGLLAAKTAHDEHDSTMMLCTIYNRLGMTYLRLRMYKDADKAYDLSLKVAKRYRDTAAIKMIMGNIISLAPKLEPKGESLNKALKMLNDLSKNYPPLNVDDRLQMESNYVIIYREMKRYPEAQVYCDRMLALSSTLDELSSGQFFVYKAAVTFFVETQQVAKAEKYLRANERYCKAKGIKQELVDNEWHWYKSDSLQGHYLSANNHLLKAITLKDQLFTEKRNQAQEQLKVRYETEQKDQDIQLKERDIELLTKKGELQKSQLEQTRTIRNAIIGGSVMLLLLLALGYNRYRLKQQSNIRLQQQQDEINRQNHSLQKLLNEKEWLLKEIHHRVKNNLQFIISLLNIQSAYLNNDEAVKAIRESQSRMFAMSLIHQKLYQSEEIAFINMDQYVRELISYLSQSMVAGTQVHFDIQIDDIDLEAVQAAPVGLILNETVTNAIKYAFPDKHGTITIQLQYTDNDTLLLRIADNGIGLPGNHLQNKESLGMSLIQTLSEQLEGDLSIRNNNGLEVSILFKQEAFALNDKM